MFSACADGFAHELHELARMFSACADGVLPTNCTNRHEFFSLRWWGVRPRIARIGTNVFSLRWWFFAHEFHEFARMLQLTLIGLPTNCTNLHECFSLRWWGFAHGFHQLARMYQLALIFFFAHELHELTRMFQLALMGWYCKDADSSVLTYLC